MKSTEELLKKIYDHFPDSEDKDETLCDLIIDSIEGGIGYWCDDMPDVDGDSEFYSENVWNAVKSGKSLTFKGDDESGVLNLENILTALERLKKNSQYTYTEIVTENWDACSCDEFFQTAIFGELVFG